ncbi:MAG: thiamine pyrophosphate-dependent enzyme [Patescibacteria group bacterium]|nr:thiamine pyrophosphate-dependent enzyme [Patescibacteria group bacterium]
MTQISDFSTTYKPTWCPGCGNFGIGVALRQALVSLDIPPHKLMAVFDIGCNSNGANWLRANVFHGLHGRPLPIGVGCKLANPELEVICFSGDGGALGEGGNHFLHTCRSNANLTYVVHDNQLYSLTTGQAAPTTDEGTETKSTPKGAPDRPLRMLQIAISAGATFVARGLADDIPGLSKLFEAALKHRGFAVLDVLQPCVTLNHINTREWYRAHTYQLAADHDSTDKAKAMALAGEWNGKIPLGIIFREERPTLEDHFSQMKGKPLTQRVAVRDVAALLEQFR